MRIKRERRFWSGLTFLVIGLAFAWSSTEYNLGTSSRPGPGYFPLGLGLLLASLGLIAIVQSVTLQADEDRTIGAWSLKPVIWISASAAIFGWALPRLGLFVAVPLVVIASGLAGNDFRWRDGLINAVVLAVGCWLIFVVGLGLFIPLWPTLPDN